MHHLRAHLPNLVPRWHQRVSRSVFWNQALLGPSFYDPSSEAPQPPSKGLPWSKRDKPRKRNLSWSYPTIWVLAPVTVASTLSLTLTLDSENWASALAHKHLLNPCNESGTLVFPGNTVTNKVLAYLHGDYRPVRDRVQETGIGSKLCGVLNGEIEASRRAADPSSGRKGGVGKTS